jgi:hypothetical protein
MPLSREHAAYHEAGHAVAAALLGIRVGRITIRPEGDNGGHTELEPRDFEAAPVDDRVTVLLAGAWGGWLDPAFDGNAAHPGAKGDLEAIRTLLGGRPDLADAGRRLAELVHHERAEPAVHALAATLLEREDVNASTDVDVARILVRLRR